MILRQYLPEPELPDFLIGYCRECQYPLSLKKRIIIALVLKLQHDSGIDALMVDSRRAGIKVSHSSVYLVLQWLVTNNLVIKTVQGHAKTVLYRPNRTELNKRKYMLENIYAFRFPSGDALQRQDAVLLIG